MNILINFVALHGGGSLYSFEMAKAMRDNGHNVYAIISTKMETFKDWQAEEGINIIERRYYEKSINSSFGNITRGSGRLGGLSVDGQQTAGAGATGDAGVGRAG